MDRQGWPENLPSPVFSRFTAPQFDLRQIWTAVMINLVMIAAVTLFLIAGSQPIPDLLDVALFLALLAYISWFTADLPEGIPSTYAS